MANSDQPKGKIEVNGDTAGINPTLRNQIITRLAINGGIQRIEAKMKQGLDEAGWSQAIREQATQLLRSGEVTTFPELEERIQTMIGYPLVDSEGTMSSLQVTTDNVRPGADQIKKEVLDVTEDKKE